MHVGGGRPTHAAASQPAALGGERELPHSPRSPCKRAHQSHRAAEVAVFVAKLAGSGEQGALLMRGCADESLCRCVSVLMSGGVGGVQPGFCAAV